ncbi:hypothetical protein GQR58_001847 [Nymphon striatum]|nr:hypothetical protein GQR58_001847 [Nymphon striatum]
MTLLYTGPPFNVLSEGRTITISLNKAHCYMEPFFVTNRPKSAEDANLLGGFEGMPLSSSHILKVHLGNLYQYIKTGSLSETTCCPRSFEDCLAQQVTSLLEEEGIRPMWPACTTYGPETWKHGLVEIYNTNEDVKLHCGMLDGLTFFPEDEVVRGMDYLKESAPEELSDLLIYFDSVYVSGSYRRVQPPPIDIV